MEQNLIFITKSITLIIYCCLFICGHQDLYSPLHLASKGGHIEVIETLVEAGGDVNVVNNEVQ